MINSSPIPSPELVEKLKDLCNLVAIELAYRAGADQELEACCEWLVHNYNYPEANNPLRAARRPKPPTLKERALETFDKLEHLFDGYGHDGETIREALQALPND
jgi:hypothetical protein